LLQKALNFTKLIEFIGNVNRCVRVVCVCVCGACGACVCVCVCVVSEILKLCQHLHSQATDLC